MVSTGQDVPGEIEDRLLWRGAQEMLGRHVEADPDGRCVWCGSGWPCPARRLAERAEAESRRPWRGSWGAQNDTNSVRTLPGWRAEVEERCGRPAVNRGRFD